MKQLFFNLKELISKGILRIFPLPITLDKAIATTLFVLTFCTLIGCETQRKATQLVRNTRVDTLYLSNVQYDSIYVYQERMQDRSKDTVYLKDVSIEYRYKLLRDTVKVVKQDSIPYEVTVVETKEITRPLTWYDHLCRAITLFFFAIAIAKAIAFVRKIKGKVI